MNRSRVLLVVAAALFLGWLAWLGVAATGKSRGPVVSRAHAAVVLGEKGRGGALVAEVEVGPDGKPGDRAKVIENYLPRGRTTGVTIRIPNLPTADGFTGSGPYLLMFTKDAGTDDYYLVEPPRSPGYDPGAAGKPTIYRWSADVEAQARTLFP